MDSVGKLPDLPAETGDRLASILDTIGDAFVSLDSSWRFIIVNKRAEDIFGRGAEELVGKRMDEEFPDLEGWDSYRTVMSERVTIIFEEYAVPARAWVEVRAYPTLDGISLIVSDITARKSAEQALEQARGRADMLAMLLDDSSQPFMVCLPEGRFMLFNRAFEELTGYSATELAALEWPEDITSPETVNAERTAVERIERTGMPQRFENELIRKDGTRVPVEVLRHGHHGPDGAVQYYYAFMTDISRRKAAEAREAESRRLDAALAAIGTAVTSTLDSEEILRRLIQLSAEAIGAKTAGITLREHGKWVLKETFGMPRDPTRSAVMDRRLESTLLDAETHAPIAVDDVESDPRVDAAAQRCLGIKSLLAVPLVAQDVFLGALIFCHRDTKAHFNVGQVEFATNLMSIVTLALDNARHYERERRIADTLQEAVLTKPDGGDGVECSVVYRPASTTASIGGDFYDVFRLDEGRVGIVAGDVSGKGLEAARLTSLLHAGLRAFAYEKHSPSIVLERLNRFVHRVSQTEVFATLFFGVLEPSSGRLAYCIAGHPQPAVVNHDGAHSLDGHQSPLVGGFPHAHFVESQTTLAVNDVLVLYTDGITEARRDREMFGQARLLETLGELRHTPTQQMPDRLVGAVLEFAGGELRDDTVVLCVSRNDGALAAGTGQVRPS